MNTSAEMVAFIKATAKVFPEMLDLTLSSGVVEKESESFISQGFTAIVGFSGGWRGLFFMDMTKETAINLAGLLTGETYQAAEEDEVLLCGAEIANVISGNAISEINNARPGLNIRLTPPSVFTGEEVSIVNIRLSSWSIVMQSTAGSIKIHLAVEEGDK